MVLPDDETWLYALPNYSKTRTVDIMKWVRQDVNNSHEWLLAGNKLIGKIEEIEQSLSRNTDSRTVTRLKKRVCLPTLGTMVESPLLEDGKISNMQSSWHLTESMLIAETLDNISNPLSSVTFSIVDLEATKLSLNTPQHVEVVDHGAGRRKSDTRMPRLEVPAKHSLDGTITVQRMEEGEDPVHRSFPVEQVENPLDKSVGNSSIVHHRDVNNPTHQTGVINHTFQKMASEPRLHVTSETRLDYALECCIDANSTFVRAADVSVNSTLLNSSYPGATFCKVLDINADATFLLNPRRSRSQTPPELNTTFVVQDEVSDGGSSNRSLRTASADIGADDDQMSSKSDGSFSSGNRLPNIGDVENVACTQEEGLRQVMSTPFRGRGQEALGLSLGENPPSPIQPKSPAQEGDHETHQSDHSDNSSVDGGQARSSRSSRSSPGNSPVGSVQVLANNVQEDQHHMERKSTPPGTSESHKIEVPAMCNGATVGVQQQAIKIRGPARPVSGLQRPTCPRRLSNIPRPQSRIPAPSGKRSARSAQSLRPPTKSAWMDGCY